MVREHTDFKLKISFPAFVRSRITRLLLHVATEEPELIQYATAPPPQGERVVKTSAALGTHPPFGAGQAAVADLARARVR